MRRAAAALVLVACGCSETASAPEDQPNAPPPDYASHAFERFVGDSAEPDVLSDRLCVGSDDPASLADKIYIDCRLEGANFSNDAAPKDEIVIVAYNLERGFGIDEQIAALSDGTVPAPDVLLVSEADRGCERTEFRNIPREMAEALGHDYVYAVEFVELPRPGIIAACEHGNFVSSRYPIGNVEARRHTDNISWFDVPDEPRLGGRIVVVADIQIGERYLHVAALHFESSPVDNDFTVAQAVETAAMIDARPFGGVPGGDTNAPFYFIDLLENSEPIDLVTQSFFGQGFIDAHAALAERGTTSDNNLVLDLVLGNERHFRFAEPGICPKASCAALSDHLPVWATVQFVD
jgi:endonuclease/exonuclease/phosphatase family metal-dependent hydrolase